MIIVPIIPNRLYAGGKLDEAGWAFVARHINVLWNLRPIPDTPPFDFTGRMLLWTPILDKQAPSLQWVISSADVMKVLIDTGNIVYVHDTAGINRLGFILTAYFMLEFGCDRDAALSIVRRKKPDVQPNPAYMALLSVYEDYLNRCRWMKGGRHEPGRSQLTSG